MSQPFTVGGYPNPNQLQMLVGGYPQQPQIQPNQPTVQTGMQPRIWTAYGTARLRPTYGTTPRWIWTAYGTARLRPTYGTTPRWIWSTYGTTNHNVNLSSTETTTNLSQIKVPGISFRKLLQNMGFNPIQGSTYPQQNPNMNLQAVHPHQLMQGMLMKDCSACKNGKKGMPGFNCAQCQEVALCQNCYFRIMNCQMVNSACHPHQLVCTKRNNIRCNVCKGMYSQKLIMNCKPCDFDRCLACYFK